MESIGKNNDFYEVLKKDISIISAKILGINIYLKNHELRIEIDIMPLYGEKDKVLRIIFSQIKEYLLYHNSSHHFYYIENYKLLKKDDLYYISFDPESSDMTIISEDDNDLILCGNIDGYFVP